MSRFVDTQTGHIKEKDSMLKALRNQLGQLQEMRAKYRRECTTLKQREDELQSELFLRESQIKQITKRNDEEGSRLNQTQLEIDR